MPNKMVGKKKDGPPDWRGYGGPRCGKCFGCRGFRKCIKDIPDSVRTTAEYERAYGKLWQRFKKESIEYWEKAKNQDCAELIIPEETIQTNNPKRLKYTSTANPQITSTKATRTSMTRSEPHNSFQSPSPSPSPQPTSLPRPRSPSPPPRTRSPSPPPRSCSFSSPPSRSPSSSPPIVFVPSPPPSPGHSSKSTNSSLTKLENSGNFHSTIDTLQRQLLTTNDMLEYMRRQLEVEKRERAVDKRERELEKREWEDLKKKLESEHKDREKEKKEWAEGKREIEWLKYRVKELEKENMELRKSFVQTGQLQKCKEESVFLQEL